jgi:predicted metal-dependent peptidase
MPDEDHALFRHRGTRAIQRMVEFAPSTGGLALWVKHQDVGVAVKPDTDATAVLLATDGNTLFYAADFETLPITLQVGLVAHEVLHIALRHTQRFLDLQKLLGDVDLKLFNICADAIVNSTLSHLHWLQLPATSVLLDRLLADALSIDQGVEKSLLEWNVERLYRAIDDRRPWQQGGRRQSPRQQNGETEANPSGSNRVESREPMDDTREATSREDGRRSSRVRALGAKTGTDLLPGPDTQGLPEEEAAQAREWSERILRGHAGDGAHSMLRALIADLPQTRTPWEQVLRTQLARSLSPRQAISWSRPTRSYIANQGRIGTHRLPFEPGFSPTKSVPRLAVVVDVSGSIEDALMERFAREIEAITRRLEAGLVLIIGDNRVQKVTRFAPGQSDLRDIDFNGGGGTDFTPLLEEADNHHPDIAVVLTDLDGPAHFRPRWPVIWAVPEAHELAVQPFGRKLTLR